MLINHQISMRSPYDFSDWTFIETGNRIIYKKVDDEEYLPYEPEVITHDEFISGLNEIGLVTRTDTYIDPDSLFNVCRGSLVREGMEHYFCIMYPHNQLYKRYLDNTIHSIIYTRKVEDDGI